MRARAQSTRVLGLRTHARVRGSGPPLVIVPGLGCASWMYARVARELARERTVSAYDPPGHGLSRGRPGFPARIEDLTDHLAAWLEESGLRGAPLLGHSLGGEVIFDLAARHPGVTGALIACAPTGIPENPSVAGQLLRLARDQSGHETGPLLPRVRVPTLLLDGTADPVIRSWTVRAIRAAIPHARVAQIPGGTHALTDSHPRAVARLTLDFLQTLEG